MALPEFVNPKWLSKTAEQQSELSYAESSQWQQMSADEAHAGLIYDLPPPHDVVDLPETTEDLWQTFDPTEAINSFDPPLTGLASSFQPHTDHTQSTVCREDTTTDVPSINGQIDSTQQFSGSYPTGLSQYDPNILALRQYQGASFEAKPSTTLTSSTTMTSDGPAMYLPDQNNHHMLSNFKPCLDNRSDTPSIELLYPVDTTLPQVGPLIVSTSASQQNITGVPEGLSLEGSGSLLVDVNLKPKPFSAGVDSHNSAPYFPNYPNQSTQGIVGFDKNFSSSASTSTARPNTMDIVGPSSTPVPTLPPSAKAMAAVTRKRVRSTDDLGQQPHTTPQDPNRVEPSSLNLDKQIVYRGPQDDVECRRREKRPRQFNGKAEQVCFGCWLRKGRCIRSDNGPCDGCKGILKRYANGTSLPKFTCDVYTKISDMRVLFQKYFVERRASLPELSSVQCLELLEPIRNILDVIEPQNPRHVFKMTDLLDPPEFGLIFCMILTYGFSVVTWREMILSLDCSLESNVNYIEDNFRVNIGFVFGPFERYYSRFPENMCVWILNILYEMVHSANPCAPMEKRQKNHFLCALETRISHFYCRLLPADPKKLNKHRRGVAMLGTTFQRTSKLLPSAYQDDASIIDDEFIKYKQRISSNTLLGGSSTPTRSLAEILEPRYPLMSTVLPENFLAISGTSVELLYTKQGRTVSHLEICLSLSETLMNGTLNLFGGTSQLVQLLAPHAMSIMARLIFDTLTDEYAQVPTTQRWTREELLFAIILLSASLCRIFVASIPGMRIEERVAWSKTYPHVSSAMYAWVEQDENIQILKDGFLIVKGKIHQFRNPVLGCSSFSEFISGAVENLLARG